MSTPGAARSALALVAVFVALAGAAAMLHAGAEREKRNVERLRVQAANVDAWSAEIERLATGQVRKPHLADARAIVEAEAAAVGLRSSLRIEHADEHEIRFGLRGVAFGDWLAWVERLHAQRIRLESCRLDAVGALGLVSATGSLRVPSQP